MFTDEEKKLKENTLFDTRGFEDAGLNPVSFAFRSVSDRCGDAVLLVELTGIPKAKAGSLYVNLYDADGDLIFSNDKYITLDDFKYMNTYKVELSDHGRTLRDARSAKIYMVTYEK